MSKTDEEILLECYMIMSDVEYDLKRWKEELEQAEYGRHLDRMIEGTVESLMLEKPRMVRMVTLGRVELSRRFVSGVEAFNASRLTNEIYQANMDALKREIGITSNIRSVVTEHQQTKEENRVQGRRRNQQDRSGPVQEIQQASD